MDNEIEYRWIKMPKFLDDRGETRNAVNARIRTGKWIEGVHWQKRDGKIWINELEFDKWIRFGNKKSHAA